MIATVEADMNSVESNSRGVQGRALPSPDEPGPPHDEGVYPRSAEHVIIPNENVGSVGSTSGIATTNVNNDSDRNILGWVIIIAFVMMIFIPVVIFVFIPRDY